MKSAALSKILSLLLMATLVLGLPAPSAVYGAVPNEAYTIVINPGHSSSPTKGMEPIAPGSSKKKAKGVSGATGKFSKIPENVTTVSVGLLLRQELQRRGYHVVMTKTTVPEALSNVDRALIGNKNNADLVISLHADSSVSSSASGASMLIPSQKMVEADLFENSSRYGKLVMDTYAAQTGLKNRGLVQRDDITGFNWSTVPTILIEMGFLSNRKEDLYVSNTKNHPAIAKAIADGIDLCFPDDGSPFRDLRNHWAKAAIEDFAAKGYLSGHSDKRFYPSLAMTRGEFVRVLNASLGIVPDSSLEQETIRFKDTQDHWAKREIEIAVAKGICKGTSEDTFMPDAPITRQEAAFMVANLKNLFDSQKSETSRFTDSSSIAPWAEAAVEGVLKAGYMSGYQDGRFDPTAPITRAEAVAMLSQVK